MRELTIDENKQLIERFPFLLPRSVWTGEVSEDYDYTYVNGIGDVPKGWERLFLLYAKHLRKELERFDYVEKFRFSQIKEKYGSMRLYNFGYPKDSQVDELTYIFEHLSTYVCEDCGNIATHITEGWITQLCKKCFQASYIATVNPDEYKKKRKDYTIRIERFDKELGFQTLRYDCRPYWDEYLRCRKMTDTEFINYIIIS